MNISEFVIDNEKLIESVYNKPALWDQHSKLYHNRASSRNLWREVATDLNATSEIVKAKWRGLRDTFRKEHARRDAASAGEADPKQAQWQYYNQMSFITDKNKQIRKPKTENVEVKVKRIKRHSSTYSQSPPLSPRRASSPPPVTSSPPSGISSLIQDDDYCYLVSLLPYLREVSKKRKLLVRAKIQEILYREQMRNDD